MGYVWDGVGRRYSLTLNLAAALAEDIPKALACPGSLCHLIKFQVCQALFGLSYQISKELTFLVLFTKTLGELMTSYMRNLPRS